MTVSETRSGGRRRRPFGAALLLLALSGSASACYHYQPVDAPAPAVGERVRVELTGAGQDRLLETQAIPFETLTGRVVESDARNLLLEVQLEASRLGFGSGTVIDTVQVARVDLRQVGVREISTGRSIFAGAVAVGAVAGIYALFSAELFDKTGDTPRTDPVFLTIPVSSILTALGSR